MTAQKPTEAGSARPSAPTASSGTSRKPWKKKTPVEAILNQIDRVREDVANKEREFLEAKAQLAKLEEFKRILEAK